MLVPREQLVSYNIDNDCYFADINARDSYYINNPYKRIAGAYCAVGNDENGWQLEQFNGASWVDIDASSDYSLIITNEGLAALTNVMQGGYQLYISGIKIINQLVTNPSTPIITWTDTDFLQAAGSSGGVVFTCGTIGSKNPGSLLKQILSWNFLSSTGGLQYTLTFPADGFGSLSDNNEEEWDIGAVGLYVKSGSDNTDVLFAVGVLPSLIKKYSTTATHIGNAVKLYLNTVLNNLGYVSNLELMEDGNMSLPEVANESLILYPYDPYKRPYNCYFVQDLFGTGIPALALPSPGTLDTQNALNSLTDNVYNPTWTYIQPSDNYLNVRAEDFADDVIDYMFVYWDTTEQKYCRAQGNPLSSSTGPNPKLALGMRLGNSIIFSGTMTNNATKYSYAFTITNGGSEYSPGNILLANSINGINFKLRVAETNPSTGEILSLVVESNTCGNIELDPNPQSIPLLPDPRSNVNVGAGAVIELSSSPLAKITWDFSSNLNKPVYCGYGTTNAGTPTFEPTDIFLGWAVGQNSIRLALDLRNEAGSARYGTTRYATNDEVAQPYTYVNASNFTAVTPKTLKDNYLEITRPSDSNVAGGSFANPIQVNSYVKFNTMVRGKNVTSTVEPNTPIDFYGLAYQACWADLAEYYEADKFYEPGTLICFDGEKEITAATIECNGIISSNPGYLLGKKSSDNTLPVALCGRIPVLFDGNCMPKFGDKIYLSSIKPGCASTVPNGPALGKIIEKDFNSKRLLECVVKITF